MIDYKFEKKGSYGSVNYVVNPTEENTNYTLNT